MSRGMNTFLAIGWQPLLKTASSITLSDKTKNNQTVTNLWNKFYF